MLGSVSSLAQPSRVQTLRAGLDLEAGRALFEKNWVSAPASVNASDGLGPLYNARSCRACHSDSPEPADNRIIRLEPGNTYYGRQLQTRAVTGLAAEVQFSQTSRESPVILAGGEHISRSEPQWQFSHWSGPVPEASIVYSVRRAPALAGIGALAKIPDAAILERADPDDADEDGISGRAVWIKGAEGETHLGRFGWQAQEASLREQIARAMQLDMGIGNPIYPDPYGDCTVDQTGCRSFAHGNSPAHGGLESDETVLDLLVLFVGSIPPPPGEDNLPGRELFMQAGCETCHRAFFNTGSVTLTAYTDLLLHDLGSGLADRRMDGTVTDTEWRTPPLWGLRNKVGAGAVYLHDGRADSLIEAILWHGGEADSAVDRFRSMTRSDQEALIHFLRRL